MPTAKARPAVEEALLIDRMLPLVLSLPARKPVPGLPKRLQSLFRELAKQDPSRDPDAIEDLIWAIWIDHADAEVAEQMALACQAMVDGDLALARGVLDALVERFPEWPEAWNKRAIVAYVEKRDAACLADIERTLTLEPRHFGAVAGFGQVCLRQGRPTEAKAAFEVALKLDPHLRGLRGLVARLDVGRKLH
ncbi:MAG: tetratricopeptide repeat protein [Bosea sp. (in: a-proteobacteria)]